MVLSGCAKRREMGAAMAVAPVAAVAAYLNNALHLTVIPLALHSGR